MRDNAVACNAKWTMDRRTLRTVVVGDRSTKLHAFSSGDPGFDLGYRTKRMFTLRHRARDED